MSRNSEEPVPLLTPEERELESKGENADIENDAGRAEPPKNDNLDHEYSVASTVKFAWLGTYFFFSLLLTLYNKLVLGMVSRIPLPGSSGRPSPPSQPNSMVFDRIRS